MKRKDIHRPSEINPEDYYFVALNCHKLEPDDLTDLAQWREVFRNHQKATGASFSGHQDNGGCDICGANCVYTAIFYHEKTNKYIEVGTICAEKLDMGDARQFKNFRTACKSATELKAGKKKAKATLVEKEMFTAWYHYISKEILPQYPANKVYIVRDIVGKLVQYGSLSEKQFDFLKSLLEQIENWDAIQKRREEEKAKAEDCPTGKVAIKGSVVSTKWHDDFYNGRTVMTVKTKEGYLIWGTVPSSLLWDEEGLAIDLKGKDVEFNANLTPSDSDSKFGFFKRPSKAKIVN